MKSIVTRLLQLSCALALTAGMASTSWAQAQDYDVKPSLPQIMEVESVDVADGIVILDGDRYRWQSSDARRSEDESTAVIDGSGGREIRFISELQRGMRVQVVTDGTAPSRAHAPLILRMERAR